MARSRAVFGERWVTFEHRYQTVLESSQEIQHCPVRCPQRPRCTSAQSHAAPTDQEGVVVAQQEPRAAPGLDQPREVLRP